MYPSRYLQYINLPQIPRHIIEPAVANIPVCLAQARQQATVASDQKDLESQSQQQKFLHVPASAYIWTDFENQALDAWCKQNICTDIYFAFQIMTGDVAVHKDKGTEIKFCYLIQSGGPEVMTTFYQADKTSVLDSYHIDQHRWHILKVNEYHGVSNIIPGQVRFSVTGRIFGS
jgi:tartrate dehydratase alpha subunit/fumarate hydratase class I-like protein